MDNRRRGRCRMPKDVEVLTTSVTHHKHTVKVSGRMIRELLPLNIPQDATVSFRVPSGGDWSDMHADVDEQNPVWVCWETSDVRDTRS
jgi:hypothetical protein